MGREIGVDQLGRRLTSAHTQAGRLFTVVSYGVIAIVVSGTQVGYAAVPGRDQPSWLTVTLAVVGFLAVPVSALAATNVSHGTVDPSEHPDVITYHTPSGLVVAGDASLVPTGTPVTVEDPTEPAVEFGDETLAEATDEFPAFGGKDE